MMVLSLLLSKKGWHQKLQSQSSSSSKLLKIIAVINNWIVAMTTCFIFNGMLHWLWVEIMFNYSIIENSISLPHLTCIYVLFLFSQECVFEQLEVKQSIFHDMERFVGKDVILSSSTSCLVPSKVFSKVQNRSRCLVSHPVSTSYAQAFPGTVV